MLRGRAGAARLPSPHSAAGGNLASGAALAGFGCLRGAAGRRDRLPVRLHPFLIPSVNASQTLRMDGSRTAGAAHPFAGTLEGWDVQIRTAPEPEGLWLSSTSWVCASKGRKGEEPRAGLECSYSPLLVLCQLLGAALAGAPAAEVSWDIC